MDKIYTKQYSVRVPISQQPLGISFDESLQEFTKDIPNNIFNFIREFIPNDRIKNIKWKILSRVSQEIEVIKGVNKDIYFFQLKAGSAENLTKKWWTLIKLTEWQTVEFQNLDNNEKICFDYFVAFSIESIGIDEDNILISLKFYFLKRWRNVIDGQILDLLQRHFNLGFIDEKVNITQQRLDEFNGQFLELNLQWTREHKWDFWKTYDANTYTEHLYVSITDTHLNTIQRLFQKKDDELCRVMKFEEASAIVEKDNIKYNVTLELDNEEFLRDLLVDLENNILYIQEDPIDKEQFLWIIKTDCGADWENSNISIINQLC